MATTARRGAPLTLDEIHAAALRLVDEGGVDALSMRKLAAELDVNPMSLYHHVPGKEALIQQICVAMADRLELPPDDGTPWQEQLRALALAYHALARAYPALFAYAYAHQQPGTDHESGIWAVLHRVLRAAGVAGPDLGRTGDVLHAFVSGFVLAETKGLIAEPGPAFDTAIDLIVHGLAGRS
ncbi:TetR/AcrR family transcriptional regulator [Nonomuraea sp. SBT364]|uniref:TetR/AcrR family transcriptional regulator n=1 Tax=Nonomuraea sp. SBT364 TaxID=1580530 RepID=UPI000B119E06|nr:TetR/AcrR family transcriptional regulator [Nonomuraea sp. SBT364]